MASNILEARPKRKVNQRTRFHPNHHAWGTPNAEPMIAKVDNVLVPVYDTDDKSVLSQLDQDAVSIRDAIDAQDGTYAVEHRPYEEYPSSNWDRLLEVVEWDFEMARMSALTIPYSIQGIAEGIFQIITVAIIGNFIGVREANAYVVVTILLEFTAAFTYGFGEGKPKFCNELFFLRSILTSKQAVGTLGPQAEGAGNSVLVGRYLQLAIIFYIIGSIPGIAIWSFLTESAVIWFGFDQETASMAQNYAYPFLATVVFEGIDSCMHEFLDITGHEKYSTFVEILHFAFQAAAVIVMAAVGYKDLVLIGIVQCFIAFLVAVANFALVLYMGWLDNYWEGLVLTFSLRVSLFYELRGWDVGFSGFHLLSMYNECLQDWKAVHTMLITAIPLGVAWLLTYGEVSTTLWEVDSNRMFLILVSTEQWELMTVFAG